TVIQIGYSQIGLSDKKNQKTGLSDEEFVQLKKDYGEMTRSATYLAMKMRMAEFASKLNGSTPNIESQEEWDKWISENLSKTAFKAIDEGKLMFKSGLYSTTKNHEEYPNVYSQLNKATRKQS